MKVIVCGAGIAGLTLAVRLGAAGWQVLLLERSGGLPDQGYMAGIFGPGYAAAERMNLIGRMSEVSYHIPQVLWLNQVGEPVACLHSRNFERALKGRLITLMRGDLGRVLFANVPASTDIRFGCAVEEIHFGRKGVEVELNDGSHEHADLLVGADGVHSRVRDLLMGDADFAFQYLGFHTASCLFEDVAIQDRLAGQLMLMSVPDRLAGFYPLRDGITAAFFVHRAPGPTLPVSAASALSEQYKSFGWVMPAALEHVRRQSPIFYDAVGQIRLSRWSLGRVTLLGDACQAVSVVAGQGASLAMHAACVLADELMSTNPLPVALGRYEQRVKPLAQHQQHRGRWAAQWFAPSSRLTLAVRNAALRTIDHSAMSWVLRPLLA